MEGSQHPLRLVQCFFEFRHGVRLSDDAAADSALHPAPPTHERTDENTAVEGAVKPGVKQASAIRATDGSLQLGNDLHRSDFR